MPNKNVNLTGDLLRVASGPQAVTMEAESAATFFVEDAASSGEAVDPPASGVIGISFKDVSLQLDADQDLFIRGRGLLVVTCKSPAF